MKTEQEFYQEYLARGYSRPQARNMAQRRYMTQVIADLKSNKPELYTQLQEKVRSMEAEDLERQRDREEFTRKQEEARRTARYKVDHALTCVGVPLPKFDLRPQEIDIDEILMAGGEGGCDQVVVSFRQWNLAADGYLHGIGRGSSYAWKEVNYADVVPGRRNDNGLYSVRLDPLGLVTNAGHYFGEFCGLLELRGTIIEHDDGVLRAEWARVLCIWVTNFELAIYDNVLMLYNNYPMTPIFVANRRQVADALFRVTAMMEMGKL